MNVQLIYHLLIAFAVLSQTASNLYAQTSEFKEELVKLRDTYQKRTQFACHFEMKSFKDHTIQTAAENISGEYLKDGVKTYSKVSDEEIISTTDFTLRINNRAKEISCFPKVAYGKTVDPFSFNIDSILSGYSNIYKGDAPAGKEAIVLERTKNICPKVYIQYDKKRYTVERLILYFDYAQAPVINTQNYWNSGAPASDQKPRVEISYSNVVTDPTIEQGLFSLEKYLIKNGNKQYVCTDAYKNYKLR